MGYLKYVKEAWKKPKENMKDLHRSRLILWRREETTVRIERPTRIDRARSIGYKAKQGLVIVRQRVKRGGKRRPWITGGRRSKHRGHRLTLRKNYKRICEERASKKFVNCEVVGSYWVAKDGKNVWYEIIMADKTHPSILKSDLKNVVKKTGRTERGLTSAGRKARGLLRKGKGAEKIRPSRAANKRLH